MSNRTQGRRWVLPPLILHPFSDAAGPGKLVESSRASMMMQGLLPNDEFTLDQLEQKLLDGRFCEIRMLCYVGRDLNRWIEQCLEIVERDDELRASGIRTQSFSELLIEDPPEAVRVKLQRWGVSDYKAVFSRALGLATIFAEPPGRSQLSSDFIRNYYRYADQFYLIRQQMNKYTPVRGTEFDFELFASGEYSRMLERQWSDQVE